jgi:DUF438 domain-containing protein
MTGVHEIWGPDSQIYRYVINQEDESFSGSPNGFSEMKNNERKNYLRDLVNLAVDCMGVAVTIIDTKGTLLYYNRHSSKILDRKPEYIGTNIHSHHKKPDSNKKVDLMLKEFAQGRRDSFHYEAKPYGETIFVTLAPIIQNGKFVGCVQTVWPKNTKYRY